ncbi:conserved hypothetical protein [Methanolacinia petrolearia DSM 11571]|uniref:DUF2238 domain-containing protein n=1 Tax=Methanolacinia petrolearia (strain DSM 11571 / OCM 486 / SEBR 4847) TaxID=679926 RepID=E1RE43_METP4|nr:hypothetical protein [Methanolacinia petrolearia]ADN34934.1 conserved hypothetical protein [Methanolacinia petrolearia DSM 11571]
MKIKPGKIITLILQVLIVLIIVASFYTGDYFFAIGGVFAFFLTIVPYIVEKEFCLVIPWWLTFLIVLSLYIHLAGEYYSWYILFYPYYDKFAHTISGITVGLLGFTAVLLIDRYTENNFNRPLIIFMIFMLTMAFGALWEIIEFTMDTFFLYGDPMQHGNTDTMLDMIFVMFGAIIVAALGNFYLRKMSKLDLSQLLAGNPDLERYAHPAEEKAKNDAEEHRDQ